MKEKMTGLSAALGEQVSGPMCRVSGKMVLNGFHVSRWKPLHFPYNIKKKGQKYVVSYFVLKVPFFVFS